MPKAGYIRPTPPPRIEDVLWTCVKRFERCTEDFHQEVLELKKEVTLLRKQTLAANKLIITLVHQQDPTDYDTLRQSNHAYKK